LQAIFNASELGAGFQIALSDLEIRGAGNILGAEQHGHMAAVGFDLYTRLLAKPWRNRADRGPFPDQPPVPSSTAGGCPPADDYVPRPPKLELYRLGRVRGRRTVRLPPGAADRFGPRPLRCSSCSKWSVADGAESAGIASISREEGELVVRFGTISRAAAMRVLAPMGREAVRFGTNQARLRLPRDPAKAWGVAQAVVARLLPAAEEQRLARERAAAAQSPAANQPAAQAGAAPDR
jgi:transcription-repair coupling factor (superfamily II helicase)